MAFFKLIDNTSNNFSNVVDLDMEARFNIDGNRYYNFRITSTMIGASIKCGTDTILINGHHVTINNTKVILCPLNITGFRYQYIDYYETSLEYFHIDGKYMIYYNKTHILTSNDKPLFTFNRNSVRVSVYYDNFRYGDIKINNGIGQTRVFASGTRDIHSEYLTSSDFYVAPSYRTGNFDFYVTDCDGYISGKRGYNIV